MTALAVVALGVPLLGAVAVVVVGRHRRALTWAAAVITAAAWTVVVAAAVPPELGRMSFDPVLAAALAGMALLIAARPPSTTLGSGAALCAVPILAATAGSGGEGIPDRPLAVGAVAVALLAVAGARSESSASWRAGAPALIGALVVAGGAITADADQAAPAVLIGAGLVLLGSLIRDAPGPLLVPTVLLAVARLVPAAAGQADPDVIAAAAGGVGLAIALAVSVLARRGPVGPERLGVAIAAGAIALFGSGLPGAAGAGLLAAAAAVLVLAAAHALALVALVPAVVVVPVVLAAGTEPRHAATGAALVALVLAGTLRPVVAPRRPPTRAGRLVAPGRGPATTPRAALARHWPTAVAVAFGILPLWGWTGSTPDDALPAAVTAGAFGLVAGVALTALAAQRAGTLDLRRAPTASSDGRTQQDLPLDGAQGLDPVDVSQAP